MSLSLQTKMDQRQIQEILYCLENEKELLLSKLDELLEDESDELDDIEYEIKEIDLDIAMYTEMFDKLYPSQVGACGYTCDGYCSECSGNYEPAYEVFAGGDY